VRQETGRRRTRTPSRPRREAKARAARAPNEQIDELRRQLDAAHRGPATRPIEYAEKAQGASATRAARPRLAGRPSARHRAQPARARGSWQARTRRPAFRPSAARPRHERESRTRRARRRPSTAWSPTRRERDSQRSSLTALRPTAPSAHSSVASPKRSGGAAPRGASSGQSSDRQRRRGPWRCASAPSAALSIVCLLVAIWILAF